MKHKLFTTLLVMLMSMVGIHVYAYDFSAANEDGVTIYYNNIDNNSVSVTYLSASEGSYSGNVRIPQTVTYQGVKKNVKKIGNAAFQNSKSLISVEIPNGLNSIGGGAFMWCTSLSTINIPASVSHIGSGAFYYCNSLTSIEIPSAITSIEEQTFEGCSSLNLNNS